MVSGCVADIKIVDDVDLFWFGNTTAINTVGVAGWLVYTNLCLFWETHTPPQQHLH